MDDFHSLDRYGRKEKGVTALDPAAQNFDLMFETIRDLKDGKTVSKPIYNHVTGLLDPPEDVKPPQVPAIRYSVVSEQQCVLLSHMLLSGAAVSGLCLPMATFMCRQGQPLTRKVPFVVVQILVAEGLHPFHDERVRKLMDFHVYLDISDEVKEAWKLQRDMQERGHSEESIRASIAARKPDFDAYIDPQKQYADVIIQVRMQQRYCAPERQL